MSRGHELPVGPEPCEICGKTDCPGRPGMKGMCADAMVKLPDGSRIRLGDYAEAIKRPTAEWHHGESGPVLVQHRYGEEHWTAQNDEPFEPEQQRSGEPVSVEDEVDEAVEDLKRKMAEYKRGLFDPDPTGTYKPAAWFNRVARACRRGDPTPTWTAEPPTEPGWWWCMEPDEYGDIEKRPEQLQRTVDGRLGRVAAFGLREVSREPDTLWHPVPLTPPESP